MFINRFMSFVSSTAFSWLSPFADGCLICGRPFIPKPGPLGALCPKCRSAVPWITRIACPVCGRPELCGDCKRRSDASIIVNRSAVRYNAVMREWLALYKYRGHEAIAPLFGEMMITAYDRLYHEMAKRNISFRFHAAVPVPLSGERLTERGFNQAERLAALIADGRGIPVAHALTRTRHSEKQSFKKRGDRLRDTEGLFAADVNALAPFIDPAVSRREADRSVYGAGTKRLRAIHEPLRLLIIDDIYTTGSTVNACAQAITAAVNSAHPDIGVELYALTLSRS